MKVLKKKNITYPSIDLKTSCIRVNNSNHFNQYNFSDILNFNLPYCSLLLTNFFSCHHLLNKEYINDLKSLNIRIFYQIRDPSETLISAANKFAYLKPELVLRNTEFFTTLCKGLKKFFDVCYEFRKDINIIKSEDRNHKKQEFLKELCNLLKIDIDEKTINSIWSKYYLKPLKPANFSNPTKNKVTKYLTKDHYKIGKEVGLWESANNFGYKTNFKKFKAEYKLISKSTLDTDYQNISDLMWNMAQHKPAMKNNKLMEKKINYKNFSFRYFTTYKHLDIESLVEKISNILDG